MNVLINLFPVQSGGGQQVATNFLNIIAQNDLGHHWFFYVGEDSELHKNAVKNFDHAAILSVKYSYKARLFNRNLLNNFITTHEIDIIYNYAPALYTRNRIPQVVRSVYSNLYFPEIDFWSAYPFFTRIKKKVIDSLRLRGTLSADGLIFENRSMQERATSLFNYPQRKTKYIEPSVSQFDESTFSSKYDFLNEIQEFKVLYLSSWHLNKNIHILPSVAEQLKTTGVKVKFVLSLSQDSPELQKKLVNVIKEKSVEDYFVFIGKVPALFVHQVVKAADAMILLSKLECFSSNVIEAFYFQKPLIISNEPWAQGECGEAVLYVDRNDVEAIADNVNQLVSSRKLNENLVNKANDKLMEFNTPEEKVLKQVQFLEKIYNEYPK